MIAPEIRSALTFTGTAVMGVYVALGILMLVTAGRAESRLDRIESRIDRINAGLDRAIAEAQADRGAFQASMGEFRKRTDEYRDYMQRLTSGQRSTGI